MMFIFFLPLSKFLMIDFCKENIVSHLQYHQSFCKIDHLQIRIVWFLNFYFFQHQGIFIWVDGFRLTNNVFEMSGGSTSRIFNL
jgi:hypothetical protein